MNTTLDPIPFSPKTKTNSNRSWSAQLTNSVVTAFVQGELNPGDPFPSPAELSKLYPGHQQEVLNSITKLLTHNILQQDPCGNLRIHPNASPSMKMKQKAFRANVRQLVRPAQKLMLPPESIRLLFREVNN
jgi:DNA-binding transcriptional regulator YhcF (GntR family)